ncbi:hypothetical protein LSAT2_015834 [Lamellibrachia satsuma]|nr:hypothetical protein LSAT2_015834 [Lamellibrachia satsuma]
MTTNPWWRVDFQKLIEVKAVAITSGQLLQSNVKVEVGPYHTRFQMCTTLSPGRYRNDITTTCQRSLRGYSVKITAIGRAVLSLCEVAVYGTHVNESCDSFPCLNGGECNNVANGYTCMCKGHINGTNCENTGKNWAVGGDAFQLSGGGSRGAASHAIDGNTDGIFAHNSCARTKHYWMVSLFDVVVVDAVVVTNRADWRGWTLHNFTVAVLPNKNPQRICKTIDREIATGFLLFN